MKTSGQIVTRRNTMLKPDIYNEFVMWTAMPYGERERLGLETQGAFAEYYRVNEATLSKWKYRPDFEPRVDKILHQWSINKTPDVINGIYRSAVKGNPYSQALWLQYFKKFNAKESDNTPTKKVEIGVNDIRFMIEGLPEELKKKHNANLQQLIDDCMHLRHTGQLENRAHTSDKPEADISGETDNDAQVVPGKRTNEVSPRNTDRVCQNMERTVSAYYYQSPQRWWQE